MAEAEKNEQTEAAETQEAPQKTSGLKTYIIIGAGFVILMVVAIALTVTLMGDSSSTGTPSGDQKSELAEQTASKQTHAAETDSLAEMALEENPELMEEIMANLEALDYEPTETEIEAAQVGMSAEDSLERVNWFKKEEERLSEWEKQLKAREQKIVKLDREVSKKLTKLEQAESTRIANLARLYDSMDPRSVAKLLHNLDDKTVVEILPRMKTKNASAALALLPAKRAARLSKQMITIAEGEGK